MFSYVAKRLLLIVPTAFGVVTATFFLIHLVPGDPVEVMLGDHAMAADRQALREALGLNLPIFEQYLRYLHGLFVGDWGQSLFEKRDVLTMLAERAPATAQLAVVALVVALVVGIPLGILAASHRGKWQDNFTAGVALTGLAMPSFWLGPLLIIIFSLWLGWFPVAGRGGWDTVILPSITLATPVAAVIMRLLRAQLLEVLGEDFVRTAEAKGCGRSRVLYGHALKNALLPVITVVFLQTGALLTGAILVEAVFAWPGLGSLLVDGLNSRDYPVVQGCVLFIALVYMLATFLSDLAYAVADPRVRHGGVA